MKLVNFKSLSIQNFLSVGQTPVTINFSSGINVITGINWDKEDSKNGVGKSTIADALYFALFGTTIRELNKDLITNSYTKKTCCVKLTLEVTTNGSTNLYEITRTLSPTKCYLIKDGVDITHSTMAKTNEYIQKIIRSTGKIFQNSVIMTINNTVPFMAQSKIDKRKFIESILSLEVFSDMLSRARDEHNELKREYDILHEKIQGLEKNYTLSKHQLDLFEETKKTKINNLTIKFNDNLIKLEELKKEITIVPTDSLKLIENKELCLQADYTKTQKEHKASYQHYSDFKTEIKHLEEQIYDINKQGSTCTTCNRPYSEDELKHKEKNINSIKLKIDNLSEKLTEAKEHLTSIEVKENKLKDDIELISSKKNKLKDILSNNKNIQTKINYISESNESIIKEKLETEQQTNETLEKIVNETLSDLTKFKTEYTDIDKELEILECVKFVVSEEGVKSYIVRKILKVLNSRLAYYLDMLQANCLCQFNEFFDETITDEKGEIKSYFNFSGGERKRIDLACLFAFLDIRRMQGDVHFSTIFYDELLDSSLDDKGVELVLRVLRERSQKFNESCYIITHRSNAVTTKVDNIVQLEKRNGFTYLL